MFAFLSLYLPTDLLVLAKMTTHCCNFVVDVPQKDHQPILAFDLLLGLHPCVIPTDYHMVPNHVPHIFLHLSSDHHHHPYLGPHLQDHQLHDVH